MLRHISGVYIGHKENGLWLRYGYLHPRPPAVQVDATTQTDCEQYLKQYIDNKFHKEDASEDEKKKQEEDFQQNFQDKGQGALALTDGEQEGQGQEHQDGVDGFDDAPVSAQVMPARDVSPPEIATEAKKKRKKKRKKKTKTAIEKASGGHVDPAVTDHDQKDVKEKGKKKVFDDASFVEPPRGPPVKRQKTDAAANV